MHYLKKLSVVLTLIVIVSILVAPVCYADDGGPPIFFNPDVDVTFTVDRAKVAPDEELDFTVDFINNSSKTLFITEIFIEVYDFIYDEKDYIAFDNIDQIVKPNETFTFTQTVTLEIGYFSFHDGTMNIYFDPTVLFKQYAPYSSSEKPVIGPTFQSFADSSLKLTWYPPYKIESPIDIIYTYKRREEEGNILYDFTVSMKNTTEQELYDLQLISDTIVYGALETKEDLSYLAPGEEKSVSYTYDNSKKLTPYIDKKQFIMSVIYRYKDSDNYIISIADKIGEMRFDLPSLKLEAKIICDVEKAYFNDTIPFTIELKNPTKHTYKDIHFGNCTGEDIIEINPGEVITRELETTRYFYHFPLILSKGLEDVYILEPTIKYQGYRIYFDEWCTNYNKISVPEIAMTMPPKTEKLKLTASSKGEIKDSKLSIEIENTSDEDIDIDFIGLPKSYDYRESPCITIGKGKKETITFSNYLDALVTDSENTYVDVCFVGEGESSRNLYWLRDYFKVNFSPQPTPTLKPTPSPSPTPKPTPAPTMTPKPTATPQPEKLIATIKNIDQESIELLLLNNSNEDVYDISVLNESGKTVHTLETLHANKYENIILVIDNNSNIALDITYKDADGNKIETTTNEIVSIKLDKTRYIEPFGGLVLVIGMLLLFIFIIIIGYQIKYSKR